MSNNDEMNQSAADGWEVISTYTRADAIEEGTLVDAGKTAREAGWKVPVALTAAVWSDCVEWTQADTDRKRVGQDEDGRLWDVVWMAGVAARAHIARCKNDPNTDPSRCRMQVYRIPRAGHACDPELVELKIIIDGGDDDGEPVATILEPNED